MTPAELNAALESATAAATENVLGDLSAAYARVLKAAGRRMATAFRRQAIALRADAVFVPPDGDEVIDYDRLAKEIAERAAFLQRQAADALDDALRREGVLSYEVGGVFTEELMDEVGKRAAFAAEADLRDTFRSTIEQAAEEGWSITRTSEEIIDNVAGMAEYRAEALARTDLVSLSNARSQATAEQAFRGEDAYKSWLATEDERTRETHWDANGQTVPIKEPFIVGGQPLRFPGDPFGSSDEVINCRCTQVYTDSLEIAKAKPKVDPLAHLKPGSELMSEAVDYWNSPSARNAAEANDMPLSEFKFQAEEKMRRELASVPVKIRTPWDVAEQVIRDGRFKSQFETQTSSGLLDDEARADGEGQMFGYPEDLAHRQRPIYGYLGDVTSERGTVGSYGSVSFVLRGSARARTTFTTSDSLGGVQIPSPLGRPSILSVYRSYNTTLKLDAPMKDWGTVYFEAQIHGGVSMDDVAKIEVYTGGPGMFSREDGAAMAERLRTATGGKIPVEVIDASGPLRGDASGAASLAEDGGGVEIAGRVDPVAASEDGLEGQLLVEGSAQAVEDAALGVSGRGTTPAGEQEVALSSDRDDLHAPDSSDLPALRGHPRRGRRLVTQRQEIEPAPADDGMRELVLAMANRLMASDEVTRMLADDVHELRQRPASSFADGELQQALGTLAEAGARIAEALEHLGDKPPPEPPTVNVTVPAPEITFAPDVQVTVEPPPSHKVITIERGADGLIESAEVEEVDDAP